MNKTERTKWNHLIKTLLPENVGYFWSQVLETAVKKLPIPPPDGDHWFKQVEEIGRSILDELGVKHETYRGFFYIEGKRVFWKNCKWDQDNYRI